MNIIKERSVSLAEVKSILKDKKKDYGDEENTNEIKIPPKKCMIKLNKKTDI